MGCIVGFYDSGIGGLPYLQWIRENSSDLSLQYLAESEYFPLGTKDDSTIKSIVISSIGRFIAKINPDLIVIACNTATVTALEDLRKIYSIPFVGVVPAVKPAAIISETKKIGLFATNKTVSQSYTQNLIKDFASDCQVVKFAMPEIVSFVEKKIITATDDEIERMLTPVVAYFRQNQVDTVILGCTHFIYLEKIFRKLLGKDIHIIDSREGVGKHALALLKSIPQAADSNVDKFYVTSLKNMPQNYNLVMKKFSLEFGGEI